MRDNGFVNEADQHAPQTPDTGGQTDHTKGPVSIRE